MFEEEERFRLYLGCRLRLSNLCLSKSLNRIVMFGFIGLRC